jgi:hypothetical protein
MKSDLPLIHKQAMNYKNFRRLRFDGGRAWIKNGQLHDAVNDGSLRVERTKAEPDVKE